MKNSNAEKLSALLKKKNIAAEPVVYTETGEAYIVLPTTVKDTNINYRVIIVFAANSVYVDIRCFKIFTEINEELKTPILEIVNALNCEKRWGKFYLEPEGEISLLESLFSSKGKFKAADIIELAIMLKDNIDELYHRITVLKNLV